MSSEDVLLVGYERPIVGREVAASAVVDETYAYLDGLKSGGKIDSYEAISLTPYGGDLSGFILIRGSRNQLDAVRSSADFDDLIVKANMMMTGVRALSGYSGSVVKGRRMDRIKKLGMDLIK